MNDRPKIAGIHKAVNMIWRMLLDGCDAPLTVWFETMWVPLGNLILAWYTVDLMNIFTAWIGVRRQPFGWRSGRHIGGGKKGRRGGGRNFLTRAAGFDPGEFIGEQIFGGEELKHRRVPPGVTYLWSIYGTIERFNFFFLVLDLGSDFIVNWMSSIVKLGYCGNREDAVLLAIKPWAQQTGIFGWSAVVWDHTEKNRKLTFWNGVGVNQIMGPGQIRMSMQAECLEHFGPTGVCGIRLRRYVGSTVETAAQEVIELTEGNSAAMVVGATIGPDELYLVEIIVDGIWEFTDMEFFMQAPWTPIA